jgi:hypothetical protein
VSGIMSAPWHSLPPISVAIAACGITGLTYAAVVVRRARRQTYYQPVWQDWLWHGLLPVTLYGALTLGGAYLRANTRAASYIIGAATLGLLLVGIHNAWDTVTHMIVRDADDAKREPGQEKEM